MKSGAKEIPTLAKGRLDNLYLLQNRLEKQYGKGVLMPMGGQQDFSFRTIRSGSILLDEALGCGGYPCGRIIEIYGPEASGKTTLTLHAVAECQRSGGIVAFIDAEHALDPVYARNLGVDIERLWLSQPDYGEQALEIVDSLVRANAVDVIVVDSVAALIPQAELNGEIGDQHVGLQARLMSQALRKLAGALAKSGATLFFINQIRTKIGVMFGSPEVTSGGNALKFYSSVRIDVRKGELLSHGNGDAFGHKIKVKVVKNKVAPPFRRTELELVFGQGLSYEGGLIDAGIKYQLIEKNGSWFSWCGEKIASGQIGQGRDNVRRQLENRPELAQKLEQELRTLMFSKDEQQQQTPADETGKKSEFEKVSETG